MNKSDVIQKLLDELNNQNQIYIAIIGIILVFFGVMQWRFSDKQIEKMRQNFKNDYGIDDLQEKLKEANELNDKLKLNITSNARIQIDMMGSLLPTADLLDSSGSRANILGNFSIAIESARQTGLLHGPVLREAMVYSINFISMHVKGKSTHELTVNEVNNFGMGLNVIEKQLEKDVQPPKVIAQFVHSKRVFDKEYTNPIREKLKSKEANDTSKHGDSDSDVN